jgi:ATP-binding cassette subfamily F protein 3
MLTIRDLTMSYGGRMLFEEAELTINWGERVALVGPNGAGKSTLFQIILGNETADSGKVERDEYAHVG